MSYDVIPLSYLFPLFYSISSFPFSISLSVHPFIYLSTYLSIYLSIPLSVYLSVHLSSSTCPSIYPSLYLCTHLSIHPPTNSVSFKELILPHMHPVHTDLLPMHPVPCSALRNTAFEALYSSSFSHFNPIQSQMFHVLYHTDQVLYDCIHETDMLLLRACPSH